MKWNNPYHTIIVRLSSFTHSTGGHTPSTKTVLIWSPKKSSIYWTFLAFFFIWCVTMCCKQKKTIKDQEIYSNSLTYFWKGSPTVCYGVFIYNLEMFVIFMWTRSSFRFRKFLLIWEVSAFPSGNYLWNFQNRNVDKAILDFSFGKIQIEDFLFSSLNAGFRW